MSEGQKESIAIAIVSSNNEFTYPYDICRKVIVEFINTGDFIFENAQGEVQIVLLEEMFPYRFTKEDLLGKE